MKTHFAALAFVTGLSLSPAAFAAGQISPDALKAERTACVSTCTGRGQAEASCSSYCDCTVKGIDAQLSAKEYTELSEAVNKDQPAPEPALEKLKAITNSCRSQIPQ